MLSIMKDWLDDLRLGVAFLTRVPMPHPDGPRPANFARIHWVFPVVGAAIGGAVGSIYLGFLELGLPVPCAAALALGAGVLLTGALHEDGLADVADGFGGGNSKATKLEIMQDSRLGTYGALALLVSFAAKFSALAALPKTGVVPSLIAAHAVARATLPALAVTMPYARTDGLAAAGGRPEMSTATVAAVLGLLIAVVTLPLKEAAECVVFAVVGAIAVAFLANRQIGGQTGDVLGAAEQVAETAVLVLLAR
jgi:adenosylcobinamide-GDP ribazoletransferase